MIPLNALVGFALTLGRIGGIFAFLSLPGIRSASGPVRIALVVLLGAVVHPFVPAAQMDGTLGELFFLMISEATLGVLFGLAIQVIHESILLGAQLLSVQAGYAYASTIDPSSEADSSVLPVMLNTAGALLFLALGLDRVVLRILVHSLQSFPPGTFQGKLQHAEPVIRLSAEIFSAGFRLAAPLVALLLMVDISMALLSRLQPSLQMLNLAFPLKMLASLVVLSLLLATLPGTIQAVSEKSLGFLQQVVSTGREASDGGIRPK